MRQLTGLLIILQTNAVFADGLLDGPTHAERGNKWFLVLQYSKAIEEHEQALQVDGKASRLHSIAESYDEMGALTDTASEALKSKRRALKIYEAFLAKAPETDPEMDPFRKTASTRIESLRQEIQELTVRVAAEREEIRVRLQVIEEKLQIAIDLLRPLQQRQAPMLPNRSKPAMFKLLLDEPAGVFPHSVSSQ